MLVLECEICRTLWVSEVEQWHTLLQRKRQPQLTAPDRLVLQAMTPCLPTDSLQEIFHQQLL